MEMEIKVGKTYYGENNEEWRKVICITGGLAVDVDYITNTSERIKRIPISKFRNWAKRDRKRSNADRVRAMSDEELAEWIYIHIIDGNCIMCPTREKQEEKDSCEDAILEWLKGDAAQWPKIAQAYKLACGRAYERRIKAGKVISWKSGDEMYNWWIANRKEKEVPGQRSFQFGLYNGEEYT